MQKRPKNWKIPLQLLYLYYLKSYGPIISGSPGMTLLDLHQTLQY